MGEVKIWKGDKVRIVREGEFKGEECLVAVSYHWGLIGLLVFNDEIPRKLVWMYEEDVEKLALSEIKNEQLKNVR